MIPLALALTILSGPVMYAHDGDTIRIADERIRLAGIDAPEIDQTCLDGSALPYRAGVASRDHLRALIGERAITCTFEKRDRYGRALGTCGGLNEAMVRDGWARASYGHQYDAAEAKARAARRGIWAGACENPAAVRERERSHRRIVKRR